MRQIVTTLLLSFIAVFGASQAMAQVAKNPIPGTVYVPAPSTPVYVPAQPSTPVYVPAQPSTPVYIPSNPTYTNNQYSQYQAQVQQIDNKIAQIRQQEASLKQQEASLRQQKRAIMQAAGVQNSSYDNEDQGNHGKHKGWAKNGKGDD